MKNVYLLPTDKPTGIFESKISGLQYSIMPKIRTNPLVGFHLYITSDEEIKEGDYVTNGKYTSQAINEWWTKFYIGNPELKADYWKIILSTDPDLIAEGVQPIDDEFIEWFVKNPSCEFVEVFHQLHKDEPLYKIIIPQEEPKQEDENYLDSFGVTKSEFETFREFNKQETIKEAAEKAYRFEADPMMPDKTEHQDFLRIFKKGARWQAERMYSEEDLLSAFEAGMMFIGEDKGSFREWFEQQKKK
jgi:hypothetical protein